MNKPPSGENTKVASSAVKMLRRKEQYILIALQRWNQIFLEPKRSRIARKTSKKTRGAQIDISKAALELIDSTTTVLTELRNELQHGDRKKVRAQS
jgi:hypothetical protein